MSNGTVEKWLGNCRHLPVVTGACHGLIGAIGGVSGENGKVVR
jgi:hypothetical protein